MVKYLYLAFCLFCMSGTAWGNYNWTEVTTSTTKPSARDGHSSILYDGQMVVFGGLDGSVKNDVWSLHLISYNWTELTTSTTKPSGRSWHSSILFDGQMIVFGGFIGGATDTNDVWTLNLTSYKWTERTTSATKPSARQDHSTICNFNF